MKFIHHSTPFYYKISIKKLLFYPFLKLDLGYFWENINQVILWMILDQCGKNLCLFNGKWRININVQVIIVCFSFLFSIFYKKKSLIRKSKLNHFENFPTLKISQLWKFSDFNIFSTLKIFQLWIFFDFEHFFTLKTFRIWNFLT